MREGRGLVYWIDAVDGTLDPATGKPRRIRFRAGSDLKRVEAVDTEITLQRQRNRTRAVKEPWQSEDERQGPTLKRIKEAYLKSQEFLALRDQRARRNFLASTVERLGLDQLAMSLTPVAIHNYIEERQAAGKSGTTINHEVAALNVALEWAVKHGPQGAGRSYLAHNPIAGFERAKYNPARTEVATYAQYRAIAAQLPPADMSDVWAFFECRIRLPFRGREMTKLDVRDVQLDRGPGLLPRIVVPAGISKSAKERVIPLWWPHLADMLRRLIGERTEGPLFRWNDTTGTSGEPGWKPYANEEGPYGAISAAIDRAGVSGLQPRDLRATAITVLVKHGIPLHDLADASDHMSLLMQHRYVRKAAELDWPLEGYYEPRTGRIEALKDVASHVTTFQSAIAGSGK